MTGPAIGNSTKAGRLAWVAMACVLCTGGCAKSTSTDRDDRPSFEVCDSGCSVSTSCDGFVSDGQCPTLPDPQHHGGIRRDNPCYYALGDMDRWGEQQSLIQRLGESLERVDVSEVVTDLDRTGLALDESEPDLSVVSGLQAAFTWDELDRGTNWMPQGVSGSADARSDGAIAGQEVVAVSWYHKPAAGEANRGVRLSLANVTALQDGEVRYRHLLLVEPFDNNGRVDFRVIGIHAGGIAWVGDSLYVVETWIGFRVFDMTQIFRASESCNDRLGFDERTQLTCAFGYKYVVPQVGAYRLAESSCAHRFSFVSLDATHEPPSLVTGEWNASAIDTHLLRWRLDSERLAADSSSLLLSTASEVVFPQESGIQGAASIGDDWYLSCSDQGGSTHSYLYRVRQGSPSSALGWVFGPEDLMHDPIRGALWSTSEFAGHRYVFSVKIPLSTE